MTGVSVIVTAHNERTFIGAAIESVLAQDRPPDEIVVVDDASSDGTHAVVDAHATARPDVMRVVTLPRRQGAPSARNAGAASAQGELLAFLDGDDMWLPQKLAVQCSILDRHLDVAYTYGSAVELRDGHLGPVPERLGSPSGVYRPPDLCTGYLRDDCWNFWPSGLLIRRSTFRLSGGFVEPLGAYQHWEDYFYACALALNDAAYVLDEPLTIYRVHDASCSHRAELSRKTIVDERAGLQWFVERLGERGPRPLPPEIIAALEERLDRNARAFLEALYEHPELRAYAHLYAPAALGRIRARLDALCG